MGFASLIYRGSVVISFDDSLSRAQTRDQSFRVRAHGIFQVSTWKRVFLFRLSKLNEDGVRDVTLRGFADFINLGSVISYL